ncbi:MAG: metallophosphoesterase family protein [Desertifilum sp.]|nr:metallophosphoesterase family protein [Desertifilum sp.]
MVQAQLLTDPFLQFPTEDSVRVVWFTEFAGTQHALQYGERLQQTAIATTTQLSRVREDGKSRVGQQTEDGQIYQQPVKRDIWRHEAIATGLTAGQRLPYRVTSIGETGESISSQTFTLAPLPPPGTPLKILLTSDHQLMPMTPANLQKVAETVGRVDAIFFAGDLVNHPDRASEWFDDNRGLAFFPALQGRTRATLTKGGIRATYTGGSLIQYAPLFPAVGNHEIMGRFSTEMGINDQFNDAYPREAAKQLYPLADLEEIKDRSFNIDTYSEIFSLPERSGQKQPYYAVTFGDIRLIVLYVTNIWRSPDLSPGTRGRYQEREQDLENPEKWGYGQHIFEPIQQGSPQYQWLTQELQRPEFQQAKYKIVMFHHPPHTLGDNIVPAYTDPVQIKERDATREITQIRYEYPKEADYIIRDLVPLLERARVQFVLYGHSHLWNRFMSPQGMHFLETSNVGNTYGAAWNEQKRPVPSGYQEEYVAVGDPNGLMPIVPTLSPLRDSNGEPLPYIASNEITAFSILDTVTGIVSSYYFDTKRPNSMPIAFDEFAIAP